MAPFSLSHTSLQDYERHLSLLAGNDAYFLEQSSDFLLEEVVLTGSASSVTFSNLDQYASTYQHLQLRVVSSDGRTSANNSPIKINFNNDSSSNYAFHGLDSNGNSVTSFSAASQTTMWITGGPAAQFGVSITDILDPFETTKNKTIRALAGVSQNPFGSETGKTISLSSGFWNSNSAITSILLTPYSGNFTQYSRFSLYGSK